MQPTGNDSTKGGDRQAAAYSSLRRGSGSLVAITSLGLGLALTSATIAVVNAYLIRSLPYPA